MKRKHFTTAIALAMLLLAIASPCASQPVTLVAVGDSLTEGDGDDGSGGGYPARLLTMLQSTYPGSTLSNRAVSGHTAQDLINVQLAAAVSDLNAAPAGNRKIALVWIGSNDLFGLYASNVCTEYYPDLPACEQGETANSCDNVNTILSNIKATGASIYIALLDDQSKRPVITDVSLRNGVFPNITDEEVPRMSAQIVNYNNQVKTLAATHGAVTVDFFNTRIFENSSTLSSDGNHPNGAGYDAIARIWYQAITGSTTTTTVVGTTTTTSLAGSTTTTTILSSTTTTMTTTTTVPSVADLGKAMAALEISAGMSASGIALSDDVNNDRKIGLPEAISALKGKPVSSGDLVQPGDFQYIGAFRLPGGDDKPKTFAYGGNAMTFNPDRNPSDSDGFPGSLFITGHDRQAYGYLPNGDQVAEVSIPVPKKAENTEDLPQAEFIQDFYDVTAGYFKDLEEIPKVGMQYLNHPDTGPKIHLCWGRHLQMLEDNLASHGWFDATLSAPNFKGVWFIGNQNPNSVNAYMLDIPTGWADTYVQGRYLGTGRVHGGGLGGMGPALIAYRPWQSGGAAPASGTHLQETALLLYENSMTTEKIEKCMKDYQHPDLWEGGAWITTPSGKTAVLFAGDKSNGTKYWYGWRHQDGPEYACPDTFFTDYVTCRKADGSPCPDEDFKMCCEEGVNCISYRGWWSTRYDAQMILYNPEDLAKVAAGSMKSWEPQPYSSIDIDEHLYLNPPVWDIQNLGAGDQRRFRLGDVAYDRIKGILYILELYADGAKPVVHVWKIQ